MWGLWLTRSRSLDPLPGVLGPQGQRGGPQHFLFCWSALPACSEVLAQVQSMPPPHFWLSRQLQIRTALTFCSKFPCQQDSWGGGLSQGRGLAVPVCSDSPSPPQQGVRAYKRQPHPKYSLCRHQQQTASLAPQEEVSMGKAVGKG